MKSGYLYLLEPSVPLQACYYQYTALLNLCSLIFVLTPFGWLFLLC